MSPVDGPLTAMGTMCRAHVHRSLVPIEVHHIWPLGDGGPNVTANKVPLCANAHGAIHYLIDRARREGSWEKVPWDFKRQFGVQVRRYAEMGYRSIVAQQLLVH